MIFWDLLIQNKQWHSAYHNRTFISLGNLDYSHLQVGEQIPMPDCLFPIPVYEFPKIMRHHHLSSCAAIVQAVRITHGMIIVVVLLCTLHHPDATMFQTFFAGMRPRPRLQQLHGTNLPCFLRLVIILWKARCSVQPRTSGPQRNWWKLSPTCHDDAPTKLPVPEGLGHIL